MKSQWKPREKAVKNPQNQDNQVCARNAKRMALRFCDQFLSWVLPLYVDAADLTVRKFRFFQCMSFLRPLVILVLYSNGRVKLVLWTDWVSLLTNFARVPMPEVSQNPLWLHIPNSKLHSLSEKATPSAIWGGLAGQKHSDAVWFWICRTWEAWCFDL